MTHRDHDIETLDPARFALHGSRLIEASAGTGKTYTIAALYLRLVLGHHGEHAYTRPLDPPEILVVTFTEAATQELRDRIRAALARGAQAFRLPADVEPDDALLARLRADYDEADWPACAHRLQLAAEWMDEAAVHTIHGWCHRMLREHAFDSDSLFTQALEADNEALLAEAARDYWRSHLVPLSHEFALAVRDWWDGPDALLGVARRLLPHCAALPEPPSPAAALAAAERTCREALERLKAPWSAWVDELQALCDDAVARRLVDRRKLQARYYQPWLDALREWCAQADLRRPDLSDSARARLCPQGLAEAWKDGKPPSHPALDALVTLFDEIDALPDARVDVLAHAARWIAGRFATELSRRARMGFDDLLTRLEAALAGVNGPRLAARVREQFPVALIDEFQDTDPVQFRIFDAIYRMAANDPDHALILIGDPKQAIYAFRGADIHTYLDARRKASDRLYTLRRNFRSSAAMVQAVNHLFDQAERRDQGRGAFLFRDAAGNPVPFLPVEAHHETQALRRDGAPWQRALTIWHQPSAQPGKPLSKTDYRAVMAHACASEIVRLLEPGGSGAATLLEPGGDAPRALSPADIAVLVNNRREAADVREALRRRGVRSVYLSEQDSVYQSEQASELHHWLAACAEPENPRLLRTALAVETLGLDWAELERLAADEIAWEARVLQFRGYRDTWRRRGVLPMLRRLLHDFDVPARLLEPGWLHSCGASGERVLTDLLHLAELLQQASALLEGEHAMLRHLAEARADEARTAGGGDARQLRLESDADLVRVVTIHKSKGLEYPLVFLPFAADCRPVSPDGSPPWLWRERGEARVALSPDEKVLAAADRERLGEDLRKLYVALTRARYATWVGVGELADLGRSAFGYLVGAQDGVPLADTLQAWAEGCPAIAVAPVPPPQAQRLRAGAPVAAPGAARVAKRRRREPWWIASYSALVQAGHVQDPQQDAARHAAAADTARQDLVREIVRARPEPGVGVSPRLGSVHAFPRGPEAGNFLHGLLEWAAERGFARLAADRAELRETVARRCQVHGWTGWIDPLTDWLVALFSSRLAAGGDAPEFSLASLRAYNAELEFWLPSQQVPAALIDRLVCEHTLDAAPRPRLQPQQLNGMLKGYVDLVFEHAGRYYVADYKSNWLGPDSAAYTPQAMRAAVLAARYDLQYVLYLLALHRLLRSRLPDYDYDRHLGGAVYIFLRGAGEPGLGMHTERPPRALIEALDAAFSGQPQGSPA